MVNRPKQIGTSAESAFVRVARARGFPHAERHVLKGQLDEGDVWLDPLGGLIVEVKGGDAARTASDNQIRAWLEETEIERRNASAEVAFLVTQRKAVGLANAHRWWAHFTTATLEHVLEPALWLPDDLVFRTTVEDALLMLRSAGFGDALTDGEK